MGKKAKNLSEEQLSQIADRIGARLEQKQVSATDGAHGAEREAAKRTHGPEREAANRTHGPGRDGATGRGRMNAYLVGGASGIVLALAAPLLRPVMRSAAKGGILVGRYARQLGSNIKEEFEDIVAEAEADLDKEKGESKEEV